MITLWRVFETQDSTSWPISSLPLMRQVRPHACSPASISQWIVGKEGRPSPHVLSVDPLCSIYLKTKKQKGIKGRSVLFLLEFCLCFLLQPDWQIQMSPCIRTFLEKIHILNRSGFVLLRGGLIDDVAVVGVVKPIIITPQIIKHMATLPSSSTLLAGLLPPTAPPPRWWRRCGLWTEIDSTNQGSVYGGPEALPVFTD